MLMLQLSAGQGPVECCLAVQQALGQLEKEATQKKVTVTVLEIQNGPVKGAIRSVLIGLNGDASSALAEQWTGTLLWVCKSPLRPKHGRKNWFISCRLFTTADTVSDNDIVFQACRSSGSGGQHVNKTHSAVHATHVATGIRVKVQTERSQHANKRLAKALIAHKLAELQNQQDHAQTQERWMAHWQLERGNPARVFKGEGFKEALATQR